MFDYLAIVNHRGKRRILQGEDYLGHKCCIIYTKNVIDRQTSYINPTQ